MFFAAALSGTIAWFGSGHDAPRPVLSVAAMLGLIGLAVRMQRVPGLSGPGPAGMAIVPWGVIVNPDVEPWVLRWPAVRGVRVQVEHEMQGGTPVVLDTRVTIAGPRGLLVGRAPGALGLEDLTVNLKAYRDEATRGVAVDLEGDLTLDVTEPVVGELLQRAHELLRTSRGAALLALPPGGYRSAASIAATPETTSILRRILAAQPDGEADARPLAAILAALVGARGLMRELYALVNAPHPVVAAVARAAALRLGAPQRRAGAIDEVAAFLFEEDREGLERWVAAAAIEREPCDELVLARASVG